MGRISNSPFNNKYTGITKVCKKCKETFYSKDYKYCVNCRNLKLDKNEFLKRIKELNENKK